MQCVIHALCTVHHVPCTMCSWCELFQRLEHSEQCTVRDHGIIVVMCRHCSFPIDPMPDHPFGRMWMWLHQLISSTSPVCKFDQGLTVLYQKIKYQRLSTDDPRLMTHDMQVLFIIIFGIIYELYVQVLFWFLASATRWFMGCTGWTWSNARPHM